VNTQRFDALTWCLGTASPRRRTLAVLLSATLGLVFLDSSMKEVTAGCKHGKRRCKNKKKERKECGGGKTCPPHTPCCLRGTCQPLCGGSCCEDCFAEILLQTGQPDFDHPICCAASGGTVCSPDATTKKKSKNKKGKKRKKIVKDDPSNDLCCYPNQTCVNGACCCNGCLGAVVCGGTCCAIAACCNGQCCGSGQVCATTPAGEACVSANRGCGDNQDCFSGEVCHGGVCCSGGRICTDGQGGDVCCDSGARCELPNNICCPINTACQSYRGHRVRR
jgi:hypothetical protein